MQLQLLNENAKGWHGKISIDGTEVNPGRGGGAWLVLTAIKEDARKLGHDPRAIGHIMNGRSKQAVILTQISQGRIARCWMCLSGRCFGEARRSELLLDLFEGIPGGANAL